MMPQQFFENRKEKTLEPIKVLLVDDEEEFVKILVERIEMMNIGPGVAFNGEQALKLVEDEIPDVMVLDIKMPGIDGLEVLRRVKKAYPDIQVIMLTGYGEDKDEREARRLGAFEFLYKPVNIEIVVNTIKRAYKHKVDSAA
jgi:DNA-binding NtrC family response regulator